MQMKPRNTEQNTLKKEGRLEFKESTERIAQTVRDIEEEMKLQPASI